MSSRFKGGVVSATPPTITSPTDGEGGSTSGVWYMTNVLSEEGGSTWPKLLLQGGLWGWGNNSSYSSPVQVGELTTWKAMALASEWAIATKSDGTLWTWGRNAQGQLGHGGTTVVSSPVQVGSLTTWLNIAGGGYHALATTTDGKLYAWGDNAVGQLGDGSTADRNAPVQIGSLTTWLRVAWLST